MNDQTENTEMEVEETEAETSGEFTLQDVERKYFDPDHLEQDAQEYIAAVSAIEGVSIKKNFDDEIPEGYGVAVIPISKREGGETVTIGVCVAAMPDVEIVAAHEKGSDFIRETVNQAFMAKIANAVRPRANGSAAGSIPFSLEDFIEGRRGAGSLKAYTAVAPIFVKALKKMGIPFMTSQILKQTLQSAQFAESQFGKVGQDKWEKVLHGMIAKAEEEGHDAAILKHWLETREEVEMSVADGLDFSLFDDMVEEDE